MISRSRRLAVWPITLLLWLMLFSQRQSTGVQAAALTTSIEAHQRACFYAWVDKAGEKVGFYFAVQSGGAFDIDYEVVNPNEKLIIGGHKERQLDIIFTGNEVGEYSFCFANAMSSFDAKVIDFDITVESEPRLSVPVSAAALLSESSAPLEESIGKVNAQLAQVSRMQRYFRTVENRGFATVRQTLSKIFWYSVVDSLVMIGVAVAQVFIVRYLFEKGSTKRYRV